MRSIRVFSDSFEGGGAAEIGHPFPRFVSLPSSSERSLLMVCAVTLWVLRARKTLSLLISEFSGQPLDFR
jgi:hypothetical protein